MLELRISQIVKTWSFHGFETSGFCKADNDDVRYLSS